MPVSLRGDIRVQMVRVFRSASSPALPSGLGDDDVVSLVGVAAAAAAGVLSLQSPPHPESDGDVRLGGAALEVVAAVAAVRQGWVSYF